MIRSCLATLLALALFQPAGFGATAAQAQGTAVRLGMPAFDSELEIEVRDLPREAAEQAIRTALIEVHTLDGLLDPDGQAAGSLGAINRAAGDGPVTIDPRIEPLLVHGLRYCLWSSGAFSPLGGKVYDLWQRHGADGKRPPPYDLREAVSAAACDQLELKPTDAGVQVRLAADARLDATGMARGYAVDYAVGFLLQSGVANAIVELGNVIRAIGGGVDGRGWMVAVPGTAGSRDPLDKLWLNDQTLALVKMPKPGDGEHLLFDLRTGVPKRGVVQVATIAEQGIDSQSLAVTLFVMGHTQGQRQLGRLSPRPSVYWLLGSNVGVPLESTYRWSEISRVGNTR